MLSGKSASQKTIESFILVYKLMKQTFIYIFENKIYYIEHYTNKDRFINTTTTF